MRLEITDSLKGGLGDLYYREACDQAGWACASLRSIFDIATRFKEENTLTFSKGSQKIKVRIIRQIVPEIIEICQPANPPSENPGFVFDYLAYKVGNERQQQDGFVANPAALCWMQAKRGRAIFTDRQVDLLSRIRLPLALFYVKDVLAAPRSIEFKWDMMSGSEWLDMLDEMKEQEEYDDEYF